RAAGRGERGEPIPLRQHRIEGGDAVHSQYGARMLRLSCRAPGPAEHDGNARGGNSGAAKRRDHREGRRNVVEREARRKENDVRGLRKVEAQRVIPSRRIDDDVVVVAGQAFELCSLGELFDGNGGLQAARLALRLPAQAGSLLDVEVRHQHLAAGTSERDGGRARERRFSDSALLGGEKNLAGHSLLTFLDGTGWN